MYSRWSCSRSDYLRDGQCWPKEFGYGALLTLSLGRAKLISEQESGKTFSLLLTASMVLLAVSLFPFDIDQALGWVPSTPSIVFGVIIALVNIVGPLMLWHSWTWKTRRGGGWEVAKVRLRKGSRE